MGFGIKGQMGLAAFVFGTSCSTPLAAPEADKSPAKLHVVGNDFSFVPGTMQVPVGRPVSVTFENRGNMAHDWVVEELDVHLAAKAGQSETKAFTFNRPGTYEISCSIPYHADYGMKGTFRVIADAVAAGQASEGMGRDPVTKPVPAGLSRLPLPQVAAPVNRTNNLVVPVEIEAREVNGLIADGVAITFWTFGGTVPGPMVRVRQGDTVQVTLKNATGSQLTHSIDFHAATGPGGGGKHTQIDPGGTAQIAFKALNPGVFVYHCATPKVANHIANGMYGLIVVEPSGGFPKVDREFYVMQGDFYLKGERGKPGLFDFSYDKMLDERPDYVLLNGSVGAIANENALKARVGETVRIFFGVGGPNLTSSFHVIGEIFDRVYAEGGSTFQTHVQTTMVPAGGSTVVDFKVDVPGSYALVDHSLGRLEKGAAGLLVVEGPEQPDIFQAIGRADSPTAPHGHDGH